MADAATVTVALRRTYGYGGTYYGPGASCVVPAGLAEALGLAPIAAPTDEVKPQVKSDTKPEPKGKGK